MNEVIKPEDTQGGDSDLKKELKDRYKYAADHYASWSKEAKNDYSFGLGDQWDEADRQALKDQARPCLTFNRIRPLINLISGYQRENSSRIKVNPEGGEDRIFSEVMDRALKMVDKWSHLNYKMGYWFDDGLFCGKGFMEAIITYENDPIRGEIQFKNLSPYQVLVDPDCNEYDINEGAQYCFKPVRLSRSKIIELYPTKKTLIKGFVSDTDDEIENGSGVLQEGDNDDYGNNPNKVTVVKRTDLQEESGLEKDDKFTVKEYWYKKMVDRFFVINKEDGEPEKFDTKAEAEAFVAKQAFGKVITRKVPEIWVAAMVGGFILQNERSPFEPFYSGFPFFRYLADWSPNADSEELRVQGVVRPLKDPQREKNKAKSQSLHILNTQANSGWIADDNALTDTGFQKLEEMGAKPGIVVRKKPGTELREILPKGPNMGMIQREEKADQEFTQISGINPDLMGFQDGTQSGKAISMRIKQAILALVRLFSNYRYSKEIVGKFMLEMMPKLFDEKKLVKVLGPEYMRTAVDPQKYPNGLTEGNVAAFLTMVEDNKYDVFVSEADQNATIRYEIFQELSELMKAGAPIPMDLLIQYMDLPNSQEVIEKIKQEQEKQMQLAQVAKGQK